MPVATSPKQGTVPVPDIYPVSRQWAEATIHFINQTVGNDFFTDPSQNISVETAFLIQKQFAFASSHMATLLEALASNSDSITLTDIPLCTAVHGNPLAAAFPNNVLPTIECRASRPVPKQASFFKRLFKNNAALPSVSPSIKNPNHGALILVSHAKELPFLNDAVACMVAAKQPVTLFSTQPVPALLPQQLASLWPALAENITVLSCADLPKQQKYIKAHLTHVRDKKIAAIQSAIQHNSLSDSQQAVLWQALATVLKLHQHRLWLQAAVEKTSPKTVVGCMEKNVRPSLLSPLQSRYGFKLVNIQHGILPRCHNLDIHKFDGFIVFNELSKHVAIADGYAQPETIYAVGNPAMRPPIADDMTTDTVNKILLWKADSPLLGAYTQLHKGYLTPAVCAQYLDVLCDYLTHRPHVKLLIKQHPLDTSTMVADTLAKYPELTERVWVASSTELTLNQSLALVDGVTSICSTVLLDALYLYKPCVALDFSRIINRIGYGYEAENLFPILTNSNTDAVTSALDNVLCAEENLDTPSPEKVAARAKIYPNDDTPYRQKLNRALQAIGCF